VSFHALLNKTADLYRLTGDSDRYGNLVNEFELQESAIPVRIDSGSSTEPGESVNTTLTNARAYTAYTGIIPFDELEVDGERWRVIGDPLPRYTQSTLHHYEIAVEKVDV
jgi:hypothetical protein